MIYKLVLQNVKRSIREYAIYLITLIMAAAFMQAFNSLIFEREIKKICSMGVFVGVMIGFAAVIVFCILTWLICYIVRFMMKKRSREFASYLMLGMEKRQIAAMFFWENLILGCFALIMGMILGTFFQIILNQAFLKLLSIERVNQIEIYLQSYLLTAGMYVFSFLFALIGNRKKFQKMKLIELLNMDKENELYFDKNTKMQKILVIFSLIYFIGFDVCLIKEYLTMGNCIFIFSGFVIACYLFYKGAAAMLLDYIESKGKAVYKGGNLFLLRQILSKARTMQVTLGTITVFFSFAFVSFSIAILFQDYINHQVEQKLPFDVIIYENDVKADFKEEETLIRTESEISESLVYHVYEDGGTQICDWLKEHKNGSSEVQMKEGESDYFAYDPFIKLSDYNTLRRMLGYEEVKIDRNHFLIHTKKRLVNGFQKFFENEKIEIGEQSLLCAGFYFEGFSQNGQNGADYIIVVPDVYVEQMNEYYSLYAASLKDELSENLYQKLTALVQEKNKRENTILWGRGTDDFVTTTGIVQVKSVQAKEVVFVLTAISYPLIYIGIIMLCVGVTILSVQQLSELPQYRKNYSILKKMGVSSFEARRMIKKQMICFYLFPYFIALIVSAGFSVWLGAYFIYYTGLSTSVTTLYISTFFMVTSVYSIYFGCTCRYVKLKVV